MRQQQLHQFLTGVTAGDAITGQAFIIRRWLHEMGLKSHIYAQYIHPSVEAEVRHLSTYRKDQKDNWAIYHHSIGSDMPDFLAKEQLRLMLIYHNVTPTEFFERSDPQRAELARLGLMQLQELRVHTGLALADSAFNMLDLKDAGFAETAVLPITLSPEQYDLPLNDTLANELRQRGPNLLFIGRLAPNKKQEDLVKLLYYCRRLDPHAHLYLVGDRWEIGYDNWVEKLATELKVAEALSLTGKVSQSDMVTYYRNSTLYISMSEHEGFGLPLIESMYLDLPVMAYGVSAVPDTLGDAGVLFYEKDFERLAELVHLLGNDDELRRRIITRQRKQLQKFLEPNVRQQFHQYLRQIGIQAVHAEAISV